jgi:hypothetical protein
MKKKSFLGFLVVIMATVSGFSLVSCGDDNDDSFTNGREQTVNPEQEPSFSVQLYSFEKGIGGNIQLVDSELKEEYNEANGLYRVTNADATVYKSIEYESYPRIGQAAQGIKRIVVVLSNDYPATTEQLTEYLNARHVLLSATNGVWTFSNSSDADRQRYQLTFTSASRSLEYVYVNEPAFVDFSGYLGKDIQKVGWGKVDETGNFLTYAPHGQLDGIVWTVDMFADWAYDNNGRRQDWKAVKTITVEFVIGLELYGPKIQSVIKYLSRIYVDDDSGTFGNYPNVKVYRDYHDAAKTMKITLSWGNATQKDENGVEREGVVYQVFYEPYKK